MAQPQKFKLDAGMLQGRLGEVKPTGAGHPALSPAAGAQKPHATR
jgi:hypothetical protein